MSLDDLASKHIDPILHQMDGTSLVGLLGSKAANVTVGHLISMRSGIGDYDVPSFDHKLLVAGGSVHSILEPLRAVAAFTASDGCSPARTHFAESCTFVCDPGMCSQATRAPTTFLPASCF